MTTNHNDRAAEIQARLDAATPEEQARYFEAIGLFAEMMKATSRDTHGEEVVEAPRDAACEEITLMRAELESQERAHAEEKARWAARLRDANRAHAELHERLAWVGHTHYGGRTCAACAAFDAHVAARAAKRADP